MSEQLTVQAPPDLRKPLVELLDATPGVTYRKRGWWTYEMVISGPPEVIEALKPRIAEIDHEYRSKEAW